MEDIRFTIRATDEAIFRSRWIEAGILEDAEGYVFRPPYPGVELSDQTRQGWLPTRADGTTPPGWHANCRVTGPLVETMIAGLEQYDAEGNLRHVIDRTWAAYIFGLTEEQTIDTESGFPYGARTEGGDVQYGDPRDIDTPANVRQ
jgi:hypothetical protein